MTLQRYRWNVGMRESVKDNDGGWVLYEEVEKLQADLDTAKGENKRLGGALKKYGKHTYDCVMNWKRKMIIVEPPKEICTCGFDQALKEMKP